MSRRLVRPDCLHPHRSSRSRSQLTGRWSRSVIPTIIANSSYDLLCTEGLARSLRIFLGKEAPPTYTLSQPAVMQEVSVEASTSPLRPMFAGAVLRLARPMNQIEYDSFIDLQDKLHQNLCRMRRFVAIGTHDLDTIEGPFR